MKIKKIISFLVILSMIISGIPITAYGTENNENMSIDRLDDYNDLYGINRNKNRSTRSSITEGNLNNIAVFIEFSDREDISIDDPETQSKAQEVFNTGGTNDSTYGKIPLISLNEYLKDLSYGKLNVKTSIYPKSNSTVVSYKPDKPRTYFMKKSTTAKDGYTNLSEQMARERELIGGALNAVKAHVEKEMTGSQIDINNDGYIDAISFYAEGEYGYGTGVEFQSLLWPHKADGYFDTKIAGKEVYSYNLVSVGDSKQPGGVFSKRRTVYGVIVHEFLHVIGLPDLYRVLGDDGDPVGRWSMMASNGQQTLNPITSFYQREVLNWGSRLDTLGSGKHTITLQAPKYINPDEKRAIIIKSPLNAKEYFIAEYRKKEGYDKYTNMDNGGIIVYRINTSINQYDGNKEKDFMYVFRPGETGLGLGKGELGKATLSKESGRTTFGKSTSDSSTFDNDTIHYSNGENSGIVISNVSSGLGDTITFDVEVPTVEGNGTASNPYIINDPSDFNLVRGQGKAYFKMTKDIDMSAVDDFKNLGMFTGNFDGQGYKISNLTINEDSISSTAALFDAIEVGGSLRNLVLENIKSKNNSGRAATLAGSVSGKIDNVQVTSGEAIGSKPESSYSIDTAAGLIGYAIETAVITNSYSKANVRGNGFVGGFIGINSNATIENCFSTGKVEGKTNSDKTGGFIGKNLLYGGEYKAPKNSYFDMKSSGQTNSIGDVELWGQITGALTGREGAIGVEIDSNVLLDMQGIKSKEIKLISNPVSSLKGNWESKDKSIATVSNGTVTGVSKGNTEVIYRLPVGTNDMLFITKVEVKDSLPFEKEDLNKDGKIDSLDIAILSNNYNKVSGQSGWNTNYDLNKDNIIDIYDLVLVSRKIK
ncbi:M6 family metalloprotease domain-containing protein [Clostridium sp. LP20]|uniref:M6 family metalloprotease domain-containing protein n=1 Tax=Clostridium sp. LP20 TaxID=3418665 RepID=UPI003EE45407